MAVTYRDMLVTALLTRKSANPKFSLRAFARDLGVSPGHLSSLMKGRKALTRKQANKLLPKLNFSPADRLDFLASVFPELAVQDSTPERERRVLRADEFSLLSEWYHYAILSLGELRDNRATSVWISRRIGITELQARDALERLKRLKLIEVYRDGSFRQTGLPLTTTDDIPLQALRTFHGQTLDLAKRKLDTVPVELREFGAITLAIHPTKLKKAKSMIREFQEKFCEELEVGKRKSVYTLAMQFFPVTEESQGS